MKNDENDTDFVLMVDLVGNRFLSLKFSKTKKGQMNPGIEPIYLFTNINLEKSSSKDEKDETDKIANKRI